MELRHSSVRGSSSRHLLGSWVVMSMKKRSINKYFWFLTCNIL